MLRLSSPRHARRALVGATLIAGLLAAPAAAQTRDQADLDALTRIKQEGTSNSKVMETLSYLTDVNGPRLTNSPLMYQASEWAQQQLKAWGLANVHTEKWGPFGRGWVNEHTSVRMDAPQPFVMLAYPKAWTPGTDGEVSGEAVAVTIDKEEDFARYKGTLKGKFVLVSPLRDIAAYFESPTRRYTQSGLDELSQEQFGARPRFPAGMNFGAPAALRKKRMAFYKEEGVLAVVEMSSGMRGDNGTVIAQGPAPGEGDRTVDGQAPLPQVVLAAEHYGRLMRVLDKKLPVKLTMNVRNRFVDTTLDSHNIIAELPGTDKADEIVMIGAHFDSWHTGTGATDNAVSSAVMMEAMRILQASGLKPRRTIRMALWTGEEQGLLGSRAYVKEHFADPTDMKPKPEHGKLSVYLNMDNGGGAFRGVYLQGNEAAAPVFEAWMKPFHNLGLQSLTIRNTSGTDHLAFDSVGLPGFQFIQDPLEYSSRTHHTNLDLYERAVPADLMQNAIVVASFAYQAANRDALFPRKPMPKARPAGQGTPGMPPAGTPGTAAARPVTQR
ncbi:peptidase M28 [Luteitalea sp. TBR-22]|uniref:M20/M25/M40 family metallo-hydrolase n=1 Tax=Luteitalea sp. TBR-22 TaxID=2802971 RepID=UPI001AF69A4C|nr:M20/M25/M40 family metallo-hydrolase [Luteitalea sp. TBR-22]BCS31264.1 peptidase M28 [Luteitalea sp. TBR-22]